MQFIFVGSALDAALAPHALHPRISEFLAREDIRRLVPFFIAALVLGQIVRILCIWLASKTMVHQDSSTLLNALKVWGFSWLAAIGVGIAIVFVLPVVAASGDKLRTGLVLIGAGMLSLLLAFLIPMKVYVIGFLRALAVIVLGFVLTWIVMFGVNLAAINAFGLPKKFADLQASFGRTPAEQQAFLQRLAGLEAPDEIDRLLDDALQPIGPRPTLAQHEATVLALQQKLEARRHTLPPGYSPAGVAFQRQLARYLLFRNAVVAERNAQPATATH